MTNQYPIIIEPDIYQYGENVFVWFDETGGVGGASNYLKEAKAQMKRYAESMDSTSPNSIIEAAWIEALDAAHEYTLTQYEMGFLKHPVDRERILALIGETK
jgi:hypothetical protein